jgi:aspartate carbamoyltransferase regulatory subunit
MLWTYHVNPIVRTPEESPELESREVEQISAVAPKARLLSVNKDQIAASDFEQVPSCLNGQERCACRSVKAQPGFQQIPTK